MGETWLEWLKIKSGERASQRGASGPAAAAMCVAKGSQLTESQSDCQWERSAQGTVRKNSKPRRQQITEN